MAWLTEKPRGSKAANAALLLLVLGVVTLVLKVTIGMVWAFVLLAALWISGHMVAWFGRHPPPPKGGHGGRTGRD